MTDVLCAKCGEPWDYGGIPHRRGENLDMTFEDAERFRKGEGCPSCHFGRVCPLCSGTGKQSESYLSSRTCCMDGRKLAWSPSRAALWSKYQPNHWYVGYEPDVQEVTDPVRVADEEGHHSRDGWVYQMWIECPECHGKGEHLFPCTRCDGSGKLDLTQEEKDKIELEAARSELDASDGEPISILVRRGLL